MLYSSLAISGFSGCPLRRPAPTRIYSHIHTHMRAYTCICAHSRAYTFIYVHIRAYTRIYAHIRAYTRIYAHMRAYTRIYAHIRTYLCIHAHILAYIRAYTRARASLEVPKHEREHHFRCPYSRKHVVSNILDTPRGPLKGSLGAFGEKS